MRFSIRQLLASIAVLALVSAYLGQSLRYRHLTEKYDKLEQRYAKAREYVKTLVGITLEDHENGPEKYSITIELPKGWPAGIKDEFKDVPPDQVAEVLVSRLSGAAH